MDHEGKRNESGIFIPLSTEEHEKVKEFIKKHAPGAKEGRYARTALFEHMDRVLKHGYAAILADILGA